MNFLNLQEAGFAEPEAGVVVGGQPDPSALQRMQVAGVARVVNLRPSSEDAGFDEPAAAQQLGLAYDHLPIAGPGDLTRDNVSKFDAILKTNGERPVLIHCASGNRVGALFALRAAWLHDKSAAEALAIGRSHGLTKMEDAVKAKLEQA